MSPSVPCSAHRASGSVHWASPDPGRTFPDGHGAQLVAGIAAIYGIEEQDDTRALVLELVEGPTLADRIAKDPIPVL